MHSPDHSTKGTPLTLGGTLPQWPLAAGESRGSGSLSSPLRGAFHLSLTVLVHYRSLKVLSLGGWSPRLPTRFLVPCGTQDTSRTPPLIALPGSHLLWPRIPARSRLCGGIVVLVLQPQAVLRPPGLGSSRFARHYSGNLMLISSRRATEMFQFTHCPPSLPMCSAGGLQTSLWRGCPIRILRALRLYAAPPERFAGLRVLLQPSAPRHSPWTLSNLSSSLCHPSRRTRRRGGRAWRLMYVVYVCRFGCVPLLRSCSRQN
jgi:hypothetical protein